MKIWDQKLTLPVSLLLGLGLLALPLGVVLGPSTHEVLRRLPGLATLVTAVGTGTWGAILFSIYSRQPFGWVWFASLLLSIAACFASVGVSVGRASFHVAITIPVLLMFVVGAYAEIRRIRMARLN